MNETEQLKNEIVNEIIKTHKKNKITDRNHVMNPYVIYQRRFQKEHSHEPISSQMMYTLASESWKGESDETKNFYRDISKEAKSKIERSIPLRIIQYKPNIDSPSNINVDIDDRNLSNEKSVSEEVSAYINIDFTNERQVNHYVKMSDEEYISLLPENSAFKYKAFSDYIDNLILMNSFIFY